MNHRELFNDLEKYYKTMDPHHDTWVLWTKDNKSTEEFFEVVVGTILVQNTNWKNVDKAVENLRTSSNFTFEKILNCPDEQLIELIKPAGFFNQKMVYLKEIGKVFTEFEYGKINRSILLKTKGIGKETADSLLNFCLRRPIPVIGTYTKRLFARLKGKVEYLSKKYEFIQEEILKDFYETTAFELGKFHALIVAHSQNVCLKRAPKCEECFLNSKCIYHDSNQRRTALFKTIDNKINPIKKQKKS